MAQFFDEQVNGGILDTHNTALSPEPQGLPGAFTPDFVKISASRTMTKYTPYTPTARTPAQHLGSTIMKSTRKVSVTLQRVTLCAIHSLSVSSSIGLGLRLRARNEFPPSESDPIRDFPGDGEKGKEVVQHEEIHGRSPPFCHMLYF